MKKHFNQLGGPLVGKLVKVLLELVQEIELNGPIFEFEDLHDLWLGAIGVGEQSLDEFVLRLLWQELGLPMFDLFISRDSRQDRIVGAESCSLAQLISNFQRAGFGWISQIDN
mmetsp:Transcript_1612/g.2228  ORF Transcript_1612/g.2228 Transcript_1612/m.2228 type:complete len:113 (+) Transcript_1612:389-727(+)